MLQACGDDDTLKKLERLHPAGNPILDRESWPDDDELRAFWASDEGKAKIDKFLSVDSIRQWFRQRPALGAPDLDGWQGREHIAFMLKDNMKTFICSSGIISYYRTCTTFTKRNMPTSALAPDSPPSRRKAVV